MSVLIHVGVRASDLSESIRFWRDGLGLRVAGERGIRYWAARRLLTPTTWNSPPLRSKIRTA